MFDAERERLLESERAARAEAEDANRAKSRFLTVMSHELRTPLNAIGGYAELIELEVHGAITAAQREALQRIQRSERHLLGLIESVLASRALKRARFASTSKGGHIRAGEYRAGARGASGPGARFICGAGRLRPAALGRRGPREGTPDSAQPAIECHEVHAARGTRHHHVREPRRHGRDLGRGFRGWDSPDKLESIFEPFVQVDTRLTRTQDGGGLGLAISRDLAPGDGGRPVGQEHVGRRRMFYAAPAVMSRQFCNQLENK